MGCEICCCGNVLREDAPCEIRLRICRCERPGPGRLAGSCPFDLLEEIPESQYNERKALGLPVVGKLEAHILQEGRKG